MRRAEHRLERELVLSFDMDTECSERFRMVGIKPKDSSYISEFMQKEINKKNISI